jgi:hypothetical protein
MVDNIVGSLYTRPEVSDQSQDTDSTYKDRQAQHDREYTAAWENAPPEFKRQAALFGLHPQSSGDTQGMAMEYNDNYAGQAHIPNMADALDDYVDQIIEEFGPEHAPFIRAIYRRLRKPMDEEIIHSRSNLLARVAMLLVFDEKGNLRARVHALLHSIPRLPNQNGFPSMRSSAKICGVSPEWLRRKRDSWCDALELSRPNNGIKSDEAKLKYRINALKNHWRNQIYKRNGNHEGITQQQQHQRQQPALAH